MPIQIIDNFELGSGKPIDNRFVVGPGQFYTDKNNITHKYTGLRVWDLTSGLPGVPYVWDGTSWQTEASSGISGSGTPTFIPKFINPGNVISDSIIKEVSGNIGIGLAGTPTDKLHVNGNIRSNGAGGFYGIGTNLTALNASNITTGILGLARLQNGTSGFILTAGASPTWTNPSSINVGSSDQSDKIYHEPDTSTTAYRRLLFLPTLSSSGYHGLRNSGSLTFRPDNSSLYLNGYMGIGVSPNTSYRLYVSGGTSYLNGNVGIGSVPGSERLLVGGDTRITGNIILQGNSSISTTSVHLDFNGPTSGSSTVNMRFFRDTNTSGGKYISFHRGNGTGTTDAEIGVGTQNTFFGSGGGKVTLVDNPITTLNSNNTVNIGSFIDTSVNGVLQITSKPGGKAQDGAAFKASSDANHIINFVNSSNVLRGKIMGINSTTVFYDTMSDNRLKKDISIMSPMIEKIKMLKPSIYKWKSSDSNGFGFIAQEVYSVFPELRPPISSYCDTDCENFDLDNPIDKEGNPYYYGLDYGQFTPFLTKALQEVIKNYEDLIDKIKNSDSIDDLKNIL
jgi:hypothetical protein